MSLKAKPEGPLYTLRRLFSFMLAGQFLVRIFVGFGDIYHLNELIFLTYVY